MVISLPGALARWPRGRGWREAALNGVSVETGKANTTAWAMLTGCGERGTGWGRGLGSSPPPPASLSRPLRAHDFPGAWPTVSRRGVGLGAEDKPCRIHLRPFPGIFPGPNAPPPVFLPIRCQENLWLGRAVWLLRACLTSPSQQQELGGEVTLCQRRPQQCYLPPALRGTPRCSAQVSATLAPQPGSEGKVRLSLGLPGTSTHSASPRESDIFC